MKELRRRIGKTFERQRKIFEAAISPLSDEEKNVFIDTFYDLPGVTDYIDQKSEDYDEASGEPFDKFINRHFYEYKAEYKRKTKANQCRSDKESKNSNPTHTGKPRVFAG